MPPLAINTSQELFVDKLGLSIDEMVVICAVHVKDNRNPLTLAHQHMIARKLADVFARGIKCPVTGKNIAIDKYKSANYKVYPYGDSRAYTHDLYEVLSTWTLIRLCLMRMNNFANAVGHAFLNRLFSIGGLSYAIELIIDVTMMLKSSFKRKEHQDSTDPFWQLTFGQRLKALFQKDNRRARMATAVTWLTINIVTLALTGGASGLVAVAGFFFDIGLEVYKLFSVNNQKSLLKKLDVRIKDLDSQIKKIDEEITEIKSQRKEAKQQRTLDYEIEINNKKRDRDLLSQERQTLEPYSPKITKKMENEKRVNGMSAAMAILCGLATAVVFLGLIFPPTVIPSMVIIIAAATTVLAGSTFGGLGPRLIAIYKRNKLRINESLHPLKYPRMQLEHSLDEPPSPSSSNSSSKHFFEPLDSGSHATVSQPRTPQRVRPFNLTNSLHARTKSAGHKSPPEFKYTPIPFNTP